MSQLPAVITVCSTVIRQHNNLHSLNDLHKASGGEKRHTPNRFMRLNTTRELVAEISGAPEMAFQTIHGGKNSGTYGCRELVIAYAAWISPAFHLRVIRVFLDHVAQGESRKSMPPPPPASPLALPFNLSARELEDAEELCRYISRQAELLHDEACRRISDMSKKIHADGVRHGRFTPGGQWIGEKKGLDPLMMYQDLVVNTMSQVAVRALYAVCEHADIMEMMVTCVKEFQSERSKNGRF